MEACIECGMHVMPNEFHPYAACLMFKGCHDSETVRANLKALNTRPTPEAITDKLGFNPDYGLEASQEALLEHMRELNRLHSLTEDIVWTGDCFCEKGIVKFYDCQGRGKMEAKCNLCNGTGQLTRPATLEEVVLFIKEALYHKTCHPKNIKVNSGTLSCKESL